MDTPVDTYKVAHLTEDELRQIQQAEKTLSNTAGKKVVLVAYENKSGGDEHPEKQPPPAPS